MARDAASVARATFEAYAERNRTKLEALIADDFHFTSPLDNRLDRKTYFARCWPNSERIEGFEIIQLATFGDKAIVTYEGQATGGKKFRNTEIHTVRDDKVHDVEVYFGWSLPHPAPPGGFVD